MQFIHSIPYPFRGRLQRRALHRTHLQRRGQGPAGTLLTDMLVLFPSRARDSRQHRPVRPDAFGRVYCSDAGAATPGLLGHVPELDREPPGHEVKVPVYVSDRVGDGETGESPDIRMRKPPGRLTRGKGTPSAGRFVRKAGQSQPMETGPQKRKGKGNRTGQDRAGQDKKTEKHANDK